MFGYLATLVVVLLLTRWVFYALRPSVEVARARESPGNSVEPGTLRTVARLVGPNFEDDEGDDPQSMGGPLADAIREGLRTRGYDPEEPYASSHGLELGVVLDGLKYEVSCGLRGAAEEDESLSEWLVFVTHGRARGAQKPAENSPNARKLVGSLHELLSALPGLKRVSWQANDQGFERGDEHWHPTPF